ncbi:MAG: C40 family peptidase [Spirochaetes bacterium]|nr:C40 family peptidase [Spirochaetota bacterium]
MRKKKYILFLLFIIPLYLSAYTSRTKIVSSLFKSVEKWMGSAYKLGGESKKGIDCSGFIAKVYKEVFDIKLPRTVRDQKKTGKIVVGNLQPGDLLFFNINGSISHVGIYVFDNKFIHAASSGPNIGVIKSSLTEKYYKTRYAFARRIITLPVYKKNNENKNINNNIKGELLFGKILFRGQLLELSEIFIDYKPIYIQIKTNNKHKKKFTISFENNNNNEKLQNITIYASTQKKYFQRIYLKKGSYKVKLFTDINKLLYEKNILVE